MKTIDRVPPLYVEDDDDAGRNPSTEPSFSEIVASRRGFLGGLLAGGSSLAVAAASAPAWAQAAGPSPSTLTFTGARHRIDDDQQLAPGYRTDIVLRWGDAVAADAPAWDPRAQTGAAQAKQFGYNNDYLAYLPLPLGSNASDHGLLHVNHEYVNPEIMFPGYKASAATSEQVEVAKAAHGSSVIEVRRQDGKWSAVAGSKYARRIDGETPIRISGPAAGHARMKTSYDPAGTLVRGMLGNCAGGKTPWGTVLTCEENFHNYFGGELAAGDPQAFSYKRYGVGAAESRYGWNKFDPRFDLGKEPNEPNRFGWVIEYDPYDPTVQPVKRTALGRFKHEGATTVLAKDGRVVVYMGDDERMDYLYRFVTKGKYDPKDRAKNRDLLDEGTLSVAKVDKDRLVWMPLVAGQGEFAGHETFKTQADIAIDTRRAADYLRPTPMDRPEDVETNPVNGKVYVVLTNNNRRSATEIEPANPRAKNEHGHILELTPPDGDHTADVYGWTILLLAGNPAVEGSGAVYHPRSEVWLSCPDNIAFDPKGRLWIATDRSTLQRGGFRPDGIYACDVDGPGRALVKFFYAVPRDAEMCGPEFTPDGTTLFVAVQHPGEGDNSTFEEPSTRWPDFKPELPPRPSVVAITKTGGGAIGS